MTDLLANPTPPIPIDVDRHNDRIYVRVGGELVSVREEATGSIVWHDLGGRLTEADKDIIRREVWNKLPWRPPVQPRNRAQRRKQAPLRGQVRAAPPMRDRVGTPLVLGPGNDPPKREE